MISSPVFTFNVIAGTVLKLQDRIRTLIHMNLVWSGITIALTLLLIPYGLRGIGFAWIAGQGITAILYLAILWNPIVRSAR